MICIAIRALKLTANVATIIVMMCAVASHNRAKRKEEEETVVLHVDKDERSTAV